MLAVEQSAAALVAIVANRAVLIDVEAFMLRMCGEDVNWPPGLGRHFHGSYIRDLADITY